MTTENAAAAVVLVAGLAYPDALAGAIAGAFFFLLLPNGFSKVLNACYTALSGIIGYSVGIAAQPDYRMLAALGGGALGVILLLAVAKAAQSEKWPEVVEKILEIVRGLR